MVAWPVFVSALSWKTWWIIAGIMYIILARIKIMSHYLIVMYVIWFVYIVQMVWEIGRWIYRFNEHKLRVHDSHISCTHTVWLRLWFVGWLVCRTIFVCVLMRVIFYPNANQKKMYCLTEHHKKCGSFVWTIEQAKRTFTLIEHLYDICFSVSEFKDCCSTRKYVFIYTK